MKNKTEELFLASSLFSRLPTFCNTSIIKYDMYLVSIPFLFVRKCRPRNIFIYLKEMVYCIHNPLCWCAWVYIFYIWFCKFIMSYQFYFWLEYLLCEGTILSNTGYFLLLPLVSVNSFIYYIYLYNITHIILYVI